MTCGGRSSHQTAWPSSERLLPKSLTYRAGSLVLAMGLGPRFLPDGASPQDSVSPHVVAVAFLRMCDPRDTGEGYNAFYDLMLEAAHCRTAFYWDQSALCH